MKRYWGQRGPNFCCLSSLVKQYLRWENQWSPQGWAVVGCQEHTLTAFAGGRAHTHVCLQMYLLWGNSCSCQTVTNFSWTYSIEKPILMNLQLYQHHKKPEFHYFSQSNWLRVTLNFNFLNIWSNVILAGTSTLRLFINKIHINVSLKIQVQRRQSCEMPHTTVPLWASLENSSCWPLFLSTGLCLISFYFRFVEAWFYSQSRCIYFRAHQLQWQNNLAPSWPICCASRALTAISKGDPSDFFFSVASSCGCCAAAERVSYSSCFNTAGTC